jgi:hypothetical protein
VRPEVLLFAIALGAAFAVLWPLAQAVTGAAPPQLLVLAAHVTGMLAGYGVVVLVGLMSRNPAVERGVGADRLGPRWPRRREPDPRARLGRRRILGGKPR